METGMKITFIGGGNMASALIGGLAGKLTAGANIHVVDIDVGALDKLHRQFGVTVATQIDRAVAASGIIVLAVKPQQLRGVAAQLRPVLQPVAQPVALSGPDSGIASARLILSIVAGIRANDLSRWLGGHTAIVRSMPNTPALVGLGIAGMVALSGVSPAQRDAADAIMKAVGSTLWLEDEALIDPVTALSGSGPAYVFYFIEAMQQAAQELGLSLEQGTQLAIATFIGASQLAAQSTEPVPVLRERVTSKGGTTHAALASMEQSGVKQALVQAIKAAAARGKALGEEFGCD